MAVFGNFLGLVMSSVMPLVMCGVMSVFGSFDRKRVVHTLH